MGLIFSDYAASSGTEKQYTMQSLMDLYALGGNLTQYTDTLESLKDYSPEKYDVKYMKETESKGALAGGGDVTTKTYKDPFFEASEFTALQSELMPHFQKRLSSIQTQKDQPGRQQLLGNQSLLG